MLKLAGLVAVALLVIVAVAYWTLRGSRDHGDEHDEQYKASASERSDRVTARGGLARTGAARAGAARGDAARGDAARDGTRSGTVRPARPSAGNSRPRPVAGANRGTSGASSSGTRPASTRSTGTRPAGAREGTAGRQPKAEQKLLAPPDGARTQRQGEDVAKTRRFGLGERVGWLRRSDVDSEMWPEESFGGVTDEQFWDDMSSDKPLASTARTAQPDGEARSRPEPRAARPGQSRLGALPGPVGGKPDRTVAQPLIQTGAQQVQGQPAQNQPIQATTQAFPAAGQLAAGDRTGPQPAYTGPQSAYSGPQSTYTGPQPVYGGPQTGPLPVRGTPRPSAQPQAYAQPLPQHLAPSQAQPPAQSMPPTQGLPAIKALPPAGSQSLGTGVQQVSRGRHSGGEDPLTSDKFSQRSAPDGRSYQAARRSRDMTREQYEAALAQETQTFSMADTDGGSGAYPVQPYDQSLPASGTGRRRRHADDRSPASDGYSYGGDAYGREDASHSYPYSQQQPSSQPSGQPSSQLSGQTPAYGGDGYGSDGYRGDSYGSSGARGGRAIESRRAIPARDAVGRDSGPRDSVPRDSAPRDSAGRDGDARDYGRPARPVYPDKRGPYDPRGGDRR
jgi:hypothetical protein